MDIERIEQEIRQVEDFKLQREQMLGAFWEHMPAIDPIIIRDRMLFLQNEIRALENRKNAQLAERQELIVRAVTLFLRPGELKSSYCFPCNLLSCL